MLDDDDDAFCLGNIYDGKQRKIVSRDGGTIRKTSEELKEYSRDLLPLLFTPVKALAALLVSFRSAF